MDNKVSLSGTGWRCWSAMQGVAERDSDQQGDDDLCGINQPGSCAYVDRYSAPAIGIPSGPVSEGEEFTPVVVGVQGVTKAILGSASMC